MGISQPSVGWSSLPAAGFMSQLGRAGLSSASWASKSPLGLVPAKASLSPVDCLQLPYKKLIIVFAAISQTVDKDAKCDKSPT